METETHVLFKNLLRNAASQSPGNNIHAVFKSSSFDLHLFSQVPVTKCIRIKKKE